MECNRDEANRAKEIAEKKFTEKDIAGAKKFAIKAQSLYPGLDGIQHMLSTLDVYISAGNRIGGEADLYGILGVNPNAKDETVRKHYRKLALMLHPDKNKSIGAEGAFKLISEAWNSLSDKSKRLAYDRKRNTPHANAGPAAPSGSNGFSKNTNTHARDEKCNAAKTDTSSGPSSQKNKPPSFWTVCHLCKMQYEYLRMYLNHNLLCPNCHRPFIATETPLPTSNGSKASTKRNSSKKQQKNHQRARKNASTAYVGSGGLNSNFQWRLFSKTADESAAQAETVVKQAHEREKREREEVQASTKNSYRKTGGFSLSGYSDVAKRRKCTEEIGPVKHGNDAESQMGRGTGGADKPKSSQVSSYIGISHLLMEKARTDIHNKVKECNKSAVGIEKQNEGGMVKDNDAVNESNASKFIPRISDDPLCLMSMDVPDSDFHDFDKNRTKNCFGENQVWAAYDDDDGMPRYYAMIHSVISLHPLKICISWLNSKPNTQLGPLYWAGSIFSKTCGDFRIGKHVLINSVNVFSHKVKWKMCAHGVRVRIFPKKGDVWALYRNWSPEWNELTSNDLVHKYDMVEVVEDYDEEFGATVTPLVKVAGFKTVFHWHLDSKEVRRIPREEMFRFSHRVPSYMLTGGEAPNAPKGCHELDPAALPLELLQVITNVKEEDIVESLSASLELEDC